MSIGLLGRYLFSDVGDDPVAVFGTGAENVLIMMVENLLPLTLIGLYIAIVLSAIMSTIDSLLIVASSAITRDFYQKIFHPEIDESTLARLSRMVTLGMALLALALSFTVAILTPERTVFWFVIFGWSGIAATFCPTIILSLWWSGMTGRGALAAMVTGFVCVPLFKFAMPQLPGWGEAFAKLSELPPAFAASMLAGIVVSRLDGRGREALREIEEELRDAGA